MLRLSSLPTVYGQQTRSYSSVVYSEQEGRIVMKTNNHGDPLETVLNSCFRSCIKTQTAI